MTFFQNKYRVESARLPYWDYANDGAYFITICTKDREHYFGEIVNGEMKLSPLGAIANVLWFEIKNRAKNITLGEFVVMPNHIHGILILTNNHEFVGCKNGGYSINKTNMDGVNQQMSQISPKPNSISTIIRSYKSAVTKHSNRLNFSFGWQTRFYDHIIRDENAFQTISNYIINNPTNWKEDKLFKKEEE